LTDFRDFLAGKSYEARTQHNRLMTALSLLKKNKIKTEFSLTADLPEFEEEPAVPYEPSELKKLFAAMKPEEVVRYKFFLGTACREKEVTYAAWQDIDFARGIYHIRRKPDVGFSTFALDIRQQRRASRQPLSQEVQAHCTTGESELRELRSAVDGGEIPHNPED